jgi:hypothetical protein
MLSTESLLVQVFDVKDDSFFLGVRNPDAPEQADLEFVSRAYNIIDTWLIAFNIASLGHFEWYDKMWNAHTLSLFKPGDKPHAIGFETNSTYKYPIDRENLTTGMVSKAALVFMALANEDNILMLKEYLRGMYHLGLEFFDLSFEKEAFANFYRAFEFFMTAKILKVTKLGNELKMFEEGFNCIGVEGGAVEMFRKDLYPLRGEQVMHAQREQRQISWDDAAKMKILADVVMHQYYKPYWEDEIKDKGH